MKKILIISITAGNGHNACAYGMKKMLEQSGEAEVRVVDLLKDYSTKRHVWVSDKGYAIAVSRLLPLYNAFYRRYQKLPPYKRYSCSYQKMILTTVRGILQEILAFEPDVVYCTHFTGSLVLTDLKLVYPLPCKTVVSSLDYVNSPFWEAGVGVDYLTVPNEDFFEEYEREGYRAEQLLPVGLPVDERTLETLSREEARRSLGLEQGVFTVLVIFGGGYWSGGFRIFQNLVKALRGRRAQIIMINGKNKKSFSKTAKVRVPEGISVLNVGFTDNVPLYLSAADLAVSKGGGLSVTEIVNKAVPILAPARLAAQEEFNVAYMKSKGVALSFRNFRELKTQTLRLMDDPRLLEEMSQKTKRLRKNAMDDLAEFILAQPSADYASIRGQVDFSSVKRSVRAALKQADAECRKAARKARKTEKLHGGGYS